jgi:hypothetical protein
MIRMEKFSLTLESTEEEVQKNINNLLQVSAYKASDMLKDIGVYDILNRPRSPEEIFHMLNFNSLDEEFFKIFDLLAHQEFLTKQGEFYGDSPRREYLEMSFKEDIKTLNSKLLSPFISFFDKSVIKYKSILKGEQGKLSEKDYVLTLDSLYGTELFFLIRELFFKSLKQRMPLFDIKETLQVLNWGSGSGYDSLHLADFFGESVEVLSVEPANSLYRCNVLQDLYEIYNVKFVERQELQLSDIQGSIDLFMGSKFIFKNDLKDYIQTIQSSLNTNGYFAFKMIPELSHTLDWILGVYDPFFYDLEKESHMANLKHHGISREKYIGLSDSFVMMQKV